jgi:hypothetical protein
MSQTIGKEKYIRFKNQCFTPLKTWKLIFFNRKPFSFPFVKQKLSFVKNDHRIAPLEIDRQSFLLMIHNPKHPGLEWHNKVEAFILRFGTVSVRELFRDRY